ncbi:MAG: NAD+ synthase [Nitrospira sp.]|nr:NAD+ synthase [Candidatus Manganitrophaceae bacterium]HIL34493.1 NAD+ synthase [Candidatus Manganitrophaceae bacterium]
MRILRIALAQINCTVGDLSGNVEKISDAIDRARKDKVDLIAFPELAIPGYPPEDLLLKPQFIDDNLNALGQVVQKSDGITVVVGFIHREEALYNAAAVIHHGRIGLVYQKCYLPNYGVFDENRYFHAGETAPVFTLQGVSVGVNICEDIWYPEGPVRAQSLAGGAELIVNINASPYHAEKGKLREEMLAARARENAVMVAYVNMVGGQDELVFDGGSLLFNEQGVLQGRGEQFEESLMIMDLSLDGVLQARWRKSRRRKVKLTTDFPEVKKWVFSEKKEKLRRKTRVPVILKKYALLREIYHALTLGLTDYVRKNGFKCGVIGLSGGIDSALTAAIAVDALGKENVVGVFMPSRYTSPESVEDVRTLAENLKIRLITHSIEPLFQSYLSLLSKPFKGWDEDITEENLQSRIRGNILMALSNKFGWIVLTTGNKSEFSVGYTTLYGDMAGGFAVIKDIWKRSVYKLARARNRWGKRVIPSRILTRPPTAELRLNQTDQDSLPPYDILDPILWAYVEEDKRFDEIVAMGFEQGTVSRVIALVDASEFKRRQSPVGIKITPRALGKDRRMPITNRYRSFYQVEKETNVKDEMNRKRKEKISGKRRKKIA